MGVVISGAKPSFSLAHACMIVFIPSAQSAWLMIWNRLIKYALFPYKCTVNVNSTWFWRLNKVWCQFSVLFYIRSPQEFPQTLQWALLTHPREILNEVIGRTPVETWWFTITCLKLINPFWHWCCFVIYIRSPQEFPQTLQCLRNYAMKRWREL